jgi:hypothetical protein
MPEEQGDARDRRGALLLGVGALIGIGLAASGAFSPADFNAVGGNVIARVNGRAVAAESYALARDRLALDKRNPMTDADREHILRRLVEEELLIQRGEAIGLVESEPSIRKAIAAAMIQAIVAESESQQPDRGELLAFYEENRGYFTPPGTLHVRQLRIRKRAGEEAADWRARGREAASALAAGEHFESVGERLGDAPLLVIPDAPLPSQKLRQYLGPSLTRLAAGLPTGSTSAFVEAEDGGRILLLVAATEGTTPAFEAISNQVEVAHRRFAGDQALREVLESLWHDAAIEFAPGAPLH